MDNRASRQTSRAKSQRARKPANDQNALFSPKTAELFQTPEKPVKELIRGKKYQLDKVIKAGKHGQVAFGHGNVTPGTIEFACKTQQIRTPENHNSRAYREYLIFKQLNQLRQRHDIYPNKNFVGFIRLLEGFKGYDTPSKGGDVVLNLIMEKADCTLQELRSMPLFELRSILFQLIFALRVAQAEFEFVHRDLHLQNVLLKAVDKKTTGATGRYRLQGLEWFSSGKWIVKISDFGLSRIKVGDKVVADHNIAMSSLFSVSDDIESLGRNLSRIKVQTDILHKQELLRLFPASDLSLFMFDDDGYTTIPDPSHPLFQAAKEYLMTCTKELQDLKRKMTRGVSAEQLVHHQLFEYLKIDPRHSITPAKQPQSEGSTKKSPTPSAILSSQGPNRSSPTSPYHATKRYPLSPIRLVWKQKQQQENVNPQAAQSAEEILPRPQRDASAARHRASERVLRSRANKAQ